MWWNVAITNAIINTIGSGPAIQETTSSRVAPIMRIMAQRNHRLSGTSASEVSRIIHQWCAPALADPSPRARPSGERMTSICGVLANEPPSPDREANDPQHQGCHDRRSYDCPARPFIPGLVEAVARIPGKMAEPGEKVKEQCGRPPQQQQDANWGGEEALYPGERVVRYGRGDQPPRH